MFSGEMPGEAAEIQSQAVYALSDLRPSAGSLPEIHVVPHLLAVIRP